MIWRETGAPRAVRDAARRALADGRTVFAVTVDGPTTRGVADGLARYVADIESIGWELGLAAPAGGTPRGPMLLLLFRPAYNAPA